MLLNQLFIEAALCTVYFRHEKQTRHSHPLFVVSITTTRIPLQSTAHNIRLLFLWDTRTHCDIQ